MHKSIQRFIKYTLWGVGGILLLLVAGLLALYFSADMQTPHHTFSATAQVVTTDSLRTYAGNYLRHSTSGLWEMKVHGDAFERGEAIGKLSQDLLYHQEKVFVDQIRTLIPSENYLSFLRHFIILFNRNLGENVPEEYRNEIYGIAQSCTHDYDFIGTPYERQLNYHSAHDLGHAMQDYMLVGCSSFACWGNETADSTLLIGRNFDFYISDAFARDKLVAFYTPEKGYRFASVGWAGMIGVLSGMNETGLTVTINAAKSDMPTASATPISILTREILQYASTIEEAYAIAQKRRTFVSESILIGSAKEGRAAIIEKSPEKIALFTGKGHRLICTNHYQSDTFKTDERNIENIATSDSPYRFARLQELLQQHQPLTPRKAATILRDYKGLHNVPLGLTNEMALNQFIAHHSVIFQPEKRLMWVSTSPWQCGAYVAYDLNQIFSDSVDFQTEIATASEMIPADAFLHEPAYRQVIAYRKMVPLIHEAINKQISLSEASLKAFKQCNPTYYHTHELLGDYHNALKQREAAVNCWQKALTLPIPKQNEKNRIQQKITQ